MYNYVWHCFTITVHLAQILLMAQFWKTCHNSKKGTFWVLQRKVLIPKTTYQIDYYPDPRIKLKLIYKAVPILRKTTQS